MRRWGTAAKAAAAGAVAAAAAVVEGAVLAGGAGLAAFTVGLGEAQADEPAPWAIELSERLELIPGAVATATVTLRGGGRHTVGRSGLLLDLTPPARGLSLRQRRYQRADAVEADAADPSFSIPIRADAAGAYTLDLRIRFWICTPRSCQPIDERRTVTLDVREPAPPPPPAAAPPEVAPPAGKLSPKPPVKR